jgi:CBS domain-containing protein
MKTGYKVCDAMTKKPVTVNPDTSIKDCASIMAKNKVGSLVVSDGTELKGIMTERHIVRKLVANNHNPLKKTILDVMDTNVTTISPDKDIYDALVLVRDLNVKQIPVVNDHNKLVGLLTIKDILKIEPQLFDLVVSKFELKEESRKPIYHVHEEEGVCAMCHDYAEKLYSISGSKICFTCKIK